MAKVVQLRKSDFYQLKITLEYVKPPIWRRIVVDSNIKLPDLHKVIQTAMGWTNSHLHQFEKGGIYYSEPSDDDFIEIVDYRKIKLNRILSKEKDFFVYEYDFGDGWTHKIILEKILKNHNKKYPECLAGKRNCPPEDCGGSGGYDELLETISDPKSEEYESMMEWLGGEFDPEYFDIEEVNELLKEDDYGCVTFL